MANVTDAAVVKAMAHPVRVRILGILEQRTASPTQLAEEIGLPLANVSYHVNQLKRLKLIELAREERR
ncbi:MAG TPA: winged helix-turn-helix domain-containing protein, partial [Thermoleophilaceae bacterium]|nr:winged helix-turn-helix domain-containing protein [Thermoleophilaceae bacterium]